MSLGRAYWASGERRRGLCSTAHPANDVERGCSLAFVLLVDPLALDGGALEAAPLPLALRLAFDGGGDVPHGQGHRSNRGQRARGHRQHRGVAGASPGCGSGPHGAGRGPVVRDDDLADVNDRGRVSQVSGTHRPACGGTVARWCRCAGTPMGFGHSRPSIAAGQRPVQHSGTPQGPGFVLGPSAVTTAKLRGRPYRGLRGLVAVQLTVSLPR
jgi:hypothetical protein